MRSIDNFGFHPVFAMAKSSAPSVAPEPASYEAAQQELEQLVARMESGQLPLDELLQAYQRGAYLLEFCRGKLTRIEDQIKVLEAGTLQAWKPQT